jgi:transcription elongation factor Elf1
MKRFNDYDYWRFSGYNSYFAVRCPRCGAEASVTIAPPEGEDADKKWLWHRGKIAFKCGGCGAIERKEPVIYRYTADAFCSDCERAFSADVTQIWRTESKAHIPCPRCGRMRLGAVRKIACDYYNSMVIKDGRDPHFGYELFYRGEFKGKLVWAINAEHLQYLIDYISADLRIDAPKRYGAKSQSDHLPTFMKIAKNRRATLKVLSKMRPR